MTADARRTCVIVAGMHRSGTSAVTRILNLLGAALPAQLVAPDKSNEAGHWEPARLVQIHDQLLAESLSRWDDWRQFDFSRFDQTRQDHYRCLLQAAVADEFADQSLIVIKDPRICRFVPLYQSILAELEIAAHYVLIHRNPASVLASLRARDQLTPNYAALVWLRHVVEAEHATRNRPRAFVGYEALLDDPCSVIDAMTNRLQVEWPVSPADAMAAINQHLRRDLEHHRVAVVNPATAADLKEVTSTTYAALLDLTAQVDEEAALHNLDLVRAQLNDRQSLFVDAVFEEMATRERRDTLDREHIQRVSSGLTRELQALDLARRRDASALAEARASARRKRLETAKILAGHARWSRHWQDHYRKAAALATEQSRTIEGLNRQLSVVIGAAADQAERHRSAIAKGERQVHALANELDQLRINQRNFDFLRTRLEAVEQSTSWRVTSPLRRLKTTAREIKRKLRVSRLQRGAATDLAGTVAPDPGNGPLVSVIVPNYNHACFLGERLDSIYQQSYHNLDVIILDDCSTDDSLAVIESYRARYPDRTRVVANRVNSGSPFRQWQRGISLARGRLIWIAESDDTCDRNFLASLLPAFDRESVLLAYCDIQHINEAGSPVGGLDVYRLATGYDYWSGPSRIPSFRMFNEGFGMRNIIPNVSGVLFRRPNLEDETLDLMTRMKTCGDWIFYMDVARGGEIVYQPQVRSYFRLHAQNSSTSAQNELAYYQEHRIVARELRRRYGTSDGALSKLDRMLSETFRYRASANKLSFDIAQNYCANAVSGIGRERLNILVASLGFYLGGGELLPIWLANALHDKGQNVTFLALGSGQPEDLAIRRTLHPGIPVLRPQSFREDRALLDNYGFDVINTHNIALEYFFRDLGLAGMPQRPCYIVTHHGSYEVSQSPAEHLRSFEPLVDHWAYLADKNLDKLRDAGLDLANASKVRNGVPVPSTEELPSREELGIPTNAFVCTLISRALPDKGWQAAVDAVVRVNAISPRPVWLVLVGDGPEHERLSRLSLPPFIKLLGFQPSAGRYHALGDVGLLPTTFPGESFPLTIVECLLAGRPCIATDVGEIRQMLAGGGFPEAGWVLDPHLGSSLESALAAAISGMIAKPERYAALANAATARRNILSIDSVADTYLALFTSLVRGSAGRPRPRNLSPAWPDSPLIRESSHNGR